MMTEYRYPELDETICRSVLPCGLRVIVIPREGFARNTAYLFVDYGSIHTDFSLDGREYHSPAGTAHYLEHKMFELPGRRDVSAEFAALGASVNAFTSYDLTAYYFSCTENFESCLRLLLEFVSTPYFPQESVDREQGIIDQEIGMNLDSPDSVIFERLMEAVYSAHNVRIPILGTSETIRQITPEILNTCHRAFYTPANMILCVMGGGDPDTVGSIAREVLGSSFRAPAEKRRAGWQEPMVPVVSRTECRMEVAMPTFTAAFKCEPLPASEEALRAELTAELASEALFGESSRLYLSLYEKGLIDSSFGGGFETLDGSAVLSFSGDSDDPDAVLEAVLAEGKRIAAEGIGEEEFLRIKRGALGRRIRGMDSFDGTCSRVCSCLISGFDYFRFPEVFLSIRPEEAAAFLDRVVRRERSAISVIRPAEEEADG